MAIRLIIDEARDISEPGTRIDVVQPGRDDQRADVGGADAGRVRNHDFCGQRRDPRLSCSAPQPWLEAVDVGLGIEIQIDPPHGLAAIGDLATSASAGNVRRPRDQHCCLR